MEINEMSLSDLKAARDLIVGKVDSLNSSNYFYNSCDNVDFDVENINNQIICLKEKYDLVNNRINEILSLLE